MQPEASSSSEKPATNPEPSAFDKQMAQRDYRLKIVTAVVSLISLNLAFWSLYDQRRRESVQAKEQMVRDVQSAFFAQRTRVYMDTSRILGRLSSATDENAFLEEVRAFDTQYWGEMCAVEDRNIERRMIEIRSLLASAVEQKTDWKELQGQLKPKSVQLANEFRNYVAGAYGINLDDSIRPGTR